MSRFKEKRRIDSAIKNGDIRELEWARCYCHTRISIATRDDHLKAWRALASTIDSAIGEATVLSILRIGHDTSSRGDGVSLQDALVRVNYLEARKAVGVDDLVPAIQANGEIVRQWLMYSEDKRTSGGWYLRESGDVGRAGDSDSTIHFESIEEAVAEYVVRELDYWAAV